MNHSVVLLVQQVLVRVLVVIIVADSLLLARNSDSALEGSYFVVSFQLSSTSSTFVTSVRHSLWRNSHCHHKLDQSSSLLFIRSRSTSTSTSTRSRRNCCRCDVFMRDSSACSWFQVGDTVKVIKDVTATSSTAATTKYIGKIGTVVETWEKCTVDPTCCCAEQVDTNMAVRVQFIRTRSSLSRSSTTGPDNDTTINTAAIITNTAKTAANTAANTANTANNNSTNTIIVVDDNRESISPPNGSFSSSSYYYYFAEDELIKYNIVQDNVPPTTIHASAI